jgi:hypothetical protein
MRRIIRRILNIENRTQEVINWEKQGRPVPPPHEIKREAIKEYKKKYKVDTLVETGTFMGHMIEAQMHRFKSIMSVELDKALYLKAKEKFAKAKNVELINGDSGEVIEGIVKNLKSQAIFWLDGHYSAGPTAKGDLNTPIMKELTYVLSSKLDHIVLIDDARHFVGKDDYPSIPELQSFVKRIRPDYSFEVKDDMIRLVKTNPAKV